jgi:hypothetical protein
MPAVKCAETTRTDLQLSLAIELRNAEDSIITAGEMKLYAPG